jgi:hypothetical protein
MLDDWKDHMNATIPSTLDVPQVTRQSVIAGGIILGDAAYSAIGIFLYHGSPKCFETKNVKH